MKKFELTSEFVTNIFGVKLFRIKALIEFGDVEEGEFGGYVEKEENLDQSGNAWVYGNAWVSGDAQVSGNAQVYGDAWVYGDAQVSGNAQVYGNAQVSGNAWVYGNALVSGNAQVYGDAWVYGDALVSGNALVYGDARVRGDADYTYIHGFGRHYRTTTFFRTKEHGICVVCGCFYGTLDEFRDEVKETHGDSKIGKEYLMIADLMEEHFKE